MLKIGNLISVWCDVCVCILYKKSIPLLLFLKGFIESKLYRAICSIVTTTPRIKILTLAKGQQWQSKCSGVSFETQQNLQSLQLLNLKTKTCPISHSAQRRLMENVCPFRLQCLVRVPTSIRRLSLLNVRAFLQCWPLITD